jgi:hypothetical protein
MQYEFDHLVIIARDQISLVAKQFSDLGFRLSAKSTHNLGSANQLIVLDSTYLEILGWEAGTVPQRAEIANLAFGLDALVFRTTNAEACFNRLKEAGFAPNAVQDLSRPAQVSNAIKQAFFKTVRFSQQPIEGLRIYFCEHVTPNFVWVKADQQHPNQLNHLQSITLCSANPAETYFVLQKLLQLVKLDNQADALNSTSQKPGPLQLFLPNCIFKIEYQEKMQVAQLIDFVLVQEGKPAELRVNQTMLRASPNNQ